jgi:hypothetical protein
MQQACCGNNCGFELVTCQATLYCTGLAVHCIEYGCMFLSIPYYVVPGIYLCIYVSLLLYTTRVFNTCSTCFWVRVSALYLGAGIGPSWARAGCQSVRAGARGLWR